jgi:LysR family transcriptional regulator, glycine cleavage system transcriptional activator
MNRPPPPLIFIRSFECTARHLSFTLAAAELGYTQAAVSSHVRALEKYVGRPLFERKTRSLKLTEIGEAFLPTLRQALQQIDNATEAVVSSTRDRSVSLACPMSLAENWIARILHGFSEAYPDIDVVIHGTVWESPGDPIADLAITINRDDEVSQGSSRLWRERLTLVCAPALAKRASTPQDIASLPKVFVLGRQEYWTIMAGALSLTHFDLDKGHKTNATNIALEMAASGLGLTVALASLTRTYLERGILVEPLPVRPESPWSYYIKPSSAHRRAASDRLRDWIVNSQPDARP